MAPISAVFLIAGEYNGADYRLTTVADLQMAHFNGGRDVNSTQPL
jgi:protein-disulfide isomerase-like protein with CxxC motif